MPRAIVIVPRVAMNGGSLQNETRNPFKNTIRRQQIIVSTTANQGLIPLHIRVALIIQLMPTSEPIERSMLPVIRTNDCPIPIRSIGAICRNKLAMFLELKNIGFIIPNAMYKTIRPIVTVTTCLIPRFVIILFIGLIFVFIFIYLPSLLFFISNMS